MEFTVQWIVFSAVAIAVGSSIETRKLSKTIWPILWYFFQLFLSYWHSHGIDIFILSGEDEA